MKKEILHLFIIFFIKSITALNPGASASLNIDTIEQAQSVYFDFIMNGVNSAPISDISF